MNDEQVYVSYGWSMVPESVDVGRVAAGASTSVEAQISVVEELPPLYVPEIRLSCPFGGCALYALSETPGDEPRLIATEPVTAFFPPELVRYGLQRYRLHVTPQAPGAFAGEVRFIVPGYEPDGELRLELSGTAE